MNFHELPDVSQLIHQQETTMQLYLDSDGCPPENCDRINGLSNAISVACLIANGGKAYAVNVNKGTVQEVLDWKQVRQRADALIPDAGPVLSAMLKNRLADHEEDYRGTTWDFKMVNAIYDRIEKVGGAVLVWT